MRLGDRRSLPPAVLQDHPTKEKSHEKFKLRNYCCCRRTVATNFKIEARAVFSINRQRKKNDQSTYIYSPCTRSARLVIVETLPRIPRELQLDLAIPQGVVGSQRGQPRQGARRPGPGDNKTEGEIMNQIPFSQKKKNE